MPPVPDGAYDVVVIEAERDAGGTLHIEVVVTLGPLVGTVFPLQRSHLVTDRRTAFDEDPLSLMGLAGVVRVRNGIPTFRPEAP